MHNISLMKYINRNILSRALFPVIFRFSSLIFSFISSYFVFLVFLFFESASSVYLNKILWGFFLIILVHVQCSMFNCAQIWVTKTTCDIITTIQYNTEYNTYDMIWMSNDDNNKNTYFFFAPKNDTSKWNELNAKKFLVKNDDVVPKTKIVYIYLCVTHTETLTNGWLEKCDWKNCLSFHYHF